MRYLGFRVYTVASISIDGHKSLYCHTVKDCHTLYPYPAKLTIDIHRNSNMSCMQPSCCYMDLFGL